MFSRQLKKKYIREKKSFYTEINLPLKRIRLYRQSSLNGIKCIQGRITISTHTLCFSVLLPQAVALYSVKIRGRLMI